MPGAEPAVDSDEDTDRRTEEHEITLNLLKPCFGVLPVDLKRAVQLRAEVGASGFIRLPEFFRAFGILGFERAQVLVCDRVGGLANDPPQRFPRDGVHVPGLQIEARRGARCVTDQVAHGLEIDRLVDELTAGDARIDCFKNIHRRY